MNFKEVFLNRFLKAIEFLKLSKNKFGSNIYKKNIPKCDTVFVAVKKYDINPNFLFCLDNVPHKNLSYNPLLLDELIKEHFLSKGVSHDDLNNLNNILSKVPFRKINFQDPNSTLDFLLSFIKKHNLPLFKKLQNYSKLELYLLFKYLFRLQNRIS